MLTFYSLFSFCYFAISSPTACRRQCQLAPSNLHLNLFILSNSNCGRIFSVQPCPHLTGFVQEDRAWSTNQSGSKLGPECLAPRKFHRLCCREGRQWKRSEEIYELEIFVFLTQKKRSEKDRLQELVWLRLKLPFSVFLFLRVLYTRKKFAH